MFGKPTKHHGQVLDVLGVLSSNICGYGSQHCEYVILTPVREDVECATRKRLMEVAAIADTRVTLETVDG